MSDTGPPNGSSAPRSDKVELRRSMRMMRRALADREERSARICAVLADVEAVRTARRLLVYTSVPGEPNIEPFAEQRRGEGAEVCVPEDEVDATWPDVIIVPGLAFTVAGDRLGQGGGWYDRFLRLRRVGVPAIGVGFAPQIVASLPIEPHDVRLDLVVTDAGLFVPAPDATGPPSAR